MAIKSVYTRKNVQIVLEACESKGFVDEIPRKVLVREISKVTGLIHDLAIRQFLKGMHETGFASPLGAGSVWEIHHEDEDYES